MIKVSDLIGIAKERLIDAEILLTAQQYDSAVYLCGYAIEIALKSKICKTLNWDGFPSSNKEFENYKSLKTHDLDVLLSFTGVGKSIKADYFEQWSVLKIWSTESRYSLRGHGRSCRRNGACC
jgi:HEPN domain-containing protein